MARNKEISAARLKLQAAKTLKGWKFEQPKRGRPKVYPFISKVTRTSPGTIGITVQHPLCKKKWRMVFVKATLQGFEVF